MITQDRGVIVLAEGLRRIERADRHSANHQFAVWRAARCCYRASERFRLLRLPLRAVASALLALLDVSRRLS